MRLEEINERLINEYISKVGCCDECFASVYCTVNGLRESRVPQDYCVNNIKRYFGDEVKPVEERPHGEWITGGKDVTGQYFYDEFICNQCFTVITDKSNFCPKCGADMRKGGAENGQL